MASIENITKLMNIFSYMTYQFLYACFYMSVKFPFKHVINSDRETYKSFNRVNISILMHEWVVEI